MKSVLLTLCIFYALSANADTYYFSMNSGDDSRTASEAQNSSTPWQTLNKLNAVLSSLSSGDEVLFNRGETWYGTITISQSGIFIGAYGSGTKPVITGFTTISGWTNEGSGIYSTVISSNSLTNMVTINGVQYGMGRTPDAGYNTYESSTNSSITDNQLASSPDWDGAEVVIRKNDWLLDRCFINNHSGTKITFTNLGSTEDVLPGHGYFIQNDLRCVTKYGEWYHDLSSGKFYMYFGAVDPTNKSVQVATINNLIYNDGYSNITVDNIALTGSIKDAVYFNFGNNNCNIQNCFISFAGRNGIGLNYRCNNNIIDNNDITNCNRGGIAANGNGNDVTNNTVKNIGVIAGQDFEGEYCDGILLNGPGSIIKYNKITNIAYSGITIDNSGPQTVQYNFIDSVCVMLDDGGAIYTAGPSTGVRVIDHNIILNVIGNLSGVNRTSPRSKGIVLDEGVTNARVTNNTVTNCIYGIHVHMGNNNTIKYNTTFNNAYTGMFFQNSKSTPTIFNNTLIGNIFVAKNLGQYVLEFLSGTSDISHLGVADSNYYARPVNDKNTFNTHEGNNNISNVDRTFEDWQKKFTLDKNSHKSPATITNVNDLRFEYNATTSERTIALGDNYMDVRGTLYPGTITLAPYSSAVLIRSGSVPNSPSTLEAEKAVIKGGQILSAATGFTGTGYVDYSSGSGNYVEWTVNAATAGAYSLKFRYANAGTTNRPLKLQVNAKVISSSLSFSTTGDWSNWSVSSATVNLVKGSNKVRLTTISSHGPNLDNLSFSKNAAKQSDQQFVSERNLAPASPGILQALVIPNPVLDNAKLNLSGFSNQLIDLQLVDMSGRILKTLRLLNGQSKTIDFSVNGLPPGAYTIILKQGNSSTYARLIVAGK